MLIRLCQEGESSSVGGRMTRNASAASLEGRGIPGHLDEAALGLQQERDIAIANLQVLPPFL